MKKQLILAVIGCMISLYAISAQNRPSWKQDVTVDGKLQEWDGALRFYDKTAKMKYGFANDSKYLYLAFEAIESEAQMKLMHGGMNIYLKTKVKPKLIGTLKLSGQTPDRSMMDQMGKPEDRMKRDQEAEFDQMKEEDQQSAGKQREGGPETDMMKKLYLLAKPTIETEGFAESNEMIVAGEGGEIAFQVAWNDQNQMDIECRIPLTELFGKGYSMDKITKKDITLVINQTQEEMPGGFGREGGPMGGGMPGVGPGGPGGMGGGMRGPDGMSGPGGNMSQNRSSMFERINIKNSIVLAAKPE